MTQPTTDEAKILHVAAELVRGSLLGKLSGLPCDMPKTTPVSVLRQIEQAEERSRQLGCELRDALDSLRERLRLAEERLSLALAVVEAAERLPDYSNTSMSRRLWDGFEAALKAYRAEFPEEPT